MKVTQEAGVGGCGLLAENQDGRVVGSSLDLAHPIHCVCHCLEVGAGPIPIPACNMELEHLVGLLGLQHQQ